LAGIQLWVQLEPVFRVQISLSVNDTERLGYPAARSTKEDDTISVPILAGHGSVTFGFAWAELMDAESVSLSKVFAVAKVEASKELEHLLGCKIYLVHVWILKGQLENAAINHYYICLCRCMAEDSGSSDWQLFKGGHWMIGFVGRRSTAFDCPWAEHIAITRNSDGRNWVLAKVEVY
jgi:hypothetical protein